MICYDVYKNLNIVVNQNKLEISSCCLMKTQHESTINFHDSAYLTKIRQSWDKNEFPSECNTCKRAEEKGETSRRHGSNRWFEDNSCNDNSVELVKLDYWTGDTCNLRCVICGPQYSSSWKQELNYPLELKKSTVNQFWKELDLSTIKFVHFNGGEPLLSKEHVTFLESIQEKDKVSINYNTNGTVLPSPALLDLWSNFKLVQLDFSIDDIEERFEYQRYPAKWPDVTKNLQWYIDNSPVNCMFAVNTTVSILNSGNLSKLQDWLSNNFSTSRVNDPIEHRRQQVSGFLNIDTVDNCRTDIISFLDACDSRRGTSWQGTFPELIQIL